MKKIIPSLFLATLANSSLLLAQNENRLNFQVRQKTEPTTNYNNQVAGYRLQVAGLKTTKLSLIDPSFQIDQGAKTTTKYELRTANCDNQGDNLDCHLLMDPAELKTVQEGIEDLKGVFGSPEKTAVSTTAAAHSPSSSSAAMLGKGGSEAGAALAHDEAAEENSTNTFLEDEICNNIYTSCLAKVAARSPSRSLIAGGTSEAAIQEAREWEAAERAAEMNLTKYESLYNKATREADKSKDHADYPIKKLAEELADARVETARATLMAIKVRNSSIQASAEAELASAKRNESDAAVAYNKAKEQAEITKWKAAAEEAQKKETAATAAGKKEESSQWNGVKGALFSAVEQKRKAIQAEASGKIELVTSWNDIVKQSIQASEFFTKAATAHAVGKKDEGKSWCNAGLSSLSVAEKTEKAIVAEAGGKKEISLSWGKAAEQDRQSIEYYIEAAAAYAAGTTSKMNEAVSLYNTGIGYSRVAEQTGKAIVAEIDGKKELSISWYKAAAISMQSSEISIKSTAAYVAGKVAEGSSWQNVSSALRRAADQTAKAFEVESSGKTELAASWREAVQQNIQASELYTQAVATHAAGKTSEGNSLDAMGKSAYNRADLLAKQAEALRLNPEVKKTAIETISATPLQSQVTEKEKEQVANIDPIQAEKPLSEKEKTAKKLNNAMEMANNAWNKNVEMARQAETAKALVSKQEDEARSLKLTDMQTKSKASSVEYRSRAADALKNNNSPRAAEYTAAAEKMDQAAECFQQSIAAFATEEKYEGECCNKAGEGYYSAAAQVEKITEQLEKAREAEVNGKLEIAHAWHEIANQTQLSVEPYTKSAAAYAACNAEEGDCWNNIGNGYSCMAEKLGKAIEAEVSGKPKIAQAWREAAKNNQLSVEPFTKSVMAYAASPERKIEEGELWSYLGEGYSYTADKLGKAIEAEVSGKPEIAQAWREAVKKNQISVEFFTRATVAYTEDKSSYWIFASSYYQGLAKNLERAIEAEGNGKTEIAGAWHEVAELDQLIAEFAIKATMAEGAGKSDEYWCLNPITMKYCFAIRSLEAAIEAEKNGMSEIAQLKREQAKLERFSGEYYDQEAIASATGKKDDLKRGEENEGEYYKKLAAYLSLFTCNLEKAIEAEIKGKSEVAQAWLKAVKQNESNVADKASGQSKIRDEGFEVAKKLENSAKQLEKSLEAEAEGKPEVAQLWREAAMQNQLSAEYYTQAIKISCTEERANAYSLLTAGDTALEEAKTLEKQAEKLNSHAEIAKQAAKETIASASAIPLQSLEIVKEKEPVKTTSSEASSVKETDDSSFATDDMLAIINSTHSIQTDETVQEKTKSAKQEGAALERSKKIKEAREKALASAGDSGDSTKYQNAIADSLEKANSYELKSEALKTAGNITLAVECAAAVEKMDQAAKCFQQSITAYAAEKEDEGGSWNSAGEGYKCAAEKLEKAIEADLNGKPEVAQAWREAAKQNQFSADSYTKVAAAYALGKEVEGFYWNNVAKGYSYTAEKLEKAIEAEVNGKPEVAQVWREVAKQNQFSVEFGIKATTAYAAGKEVEANNWSEAGDASKCAAEKLEEAIEAKVSGKLEVAQAWRDAFKQNQHSCDSYTRAATAYAVGKEQEADYWYSAGHCYHRTAVYLELAIGLVDGRPESAQVSREAAKQYEFSSECFTKAAIAHAAEKKDENICWNTAGIGYRNAAEKLEKAIDKEFEEQEVAAQAWREVSKQNQHSGESYSKAAPLKYSSPSDTGYGWYKAGSAYSSAAKQLEKAIETESSRKSEIAQAWREVAKQNQLAGEAFDKTSMAHAKGEEDEGESENWNSAGEGYMCSAEKLEKAIEAKVSGKSEIAQAWREAAKQNQLAGESLNSNIGEAFNCAAENLEKAIEADLNGKPEVAQVWREAAKQNQHSGECHAKDAIMPNTMWGAAYRYKMAAEELAKSAEHLEKALEAEANGKSEIGQAWREAAKKNHLSVESYIKVAIAHVKEGEYFKADEKYEYLDNAVYTYKEAVEELEKVPEQLEKAIEAEGNGKLEIARAWRDVAKQNQLCSESYTKAAMAQAAEKEDENDSWKHEGYSYSYAAEKLEKAIEAEINGKPEIAQVWREAAKQSELSVEPYTKAATAYASGKKDEGHYWNSVGKGYYWGAIRLEKAIEAEIKGKSEIAQTWREAAKQHQLSAEHYIQAVTAHAEGKTAEASSLDATGKAAFERADVLAKQAETLAQKEKPELEAAKVKKDSEHHVQVKNTEASGNSSDYVHSDQADTSVLEH